MTVYVEFMYDGTTHELCFARSKVTMNDGNNNLVGGTIHLHFSNCSSIIDSHDIAFPGGTGAHTYFGNKEGAACGDTTANFQATNGVWVPGPGSTTFDDSGNQNG
jgi:hypothetical protein